MYRIMKRCFRNDKDGWPACMWYVETYKRGFFRGRWVQYTYGSGIVPVVFVSEAEAKRYVLGLRTPVPPDEEVCAQWQQ